MVLGGVWGVDLTYITDNADALQHLTFSLLYPSSLVSPVWFGATLLY